jgi:hypothetical protein
MCSHANSRGKMIALPHATGAARERLSPAEKNFQMSAVTVSDLSEIRLPWLVRVRLRRIGRQHRNGILLYGLIRTAMRSTSKWAPSVSVLEGGTAYCRCSNVSKVPKWADLQPGVHELRLRVSRRALHSEVEASVVLEPGDVLIALCRPIETKFWWENRRTTDRWYVGVRHGGAAQR